MGEQGNSNRLAHDQREQDHQRHRVDVAEGDARVGPGEEEQAEIHRQLELVLELVKHPNPVAVVACRVGLRQFLALVLRVLFEGLILVGCGVQRGQEGNDHHQGQGRLNTCLDQPHPAHAPGDQDVTGHQGIPIRRNK